MSQSPVVKVRQFTDGSVDATISTPYGETIASVRVSRRTGFNERFAEHEVEVAVRDLDLDRQDETHLLGSTSRVKVPLATGESEEIATELGVIR